MEQIEKKTKQGVLTPVKYLCKTLRLPLLQLEAA